MTPAQRIILVSSIFVALGGGTYLGIKAHETVHGPYGPFAMLCEQWRLEGRAPKACDEGYRD